jgi:hypothetical protein
MSNCVVEVKDLPTTPQEVLQWVNDTSAPGIPGKWGTARIYCCNPFTNKYWGISLGVFMSGRSGELWVDANSWDVLSCHNKPNSRPTQEDYRDLNIVQAYGANPQGAIAHWLKLCLSP